MDLAKEKKVMLKAAKEAGRILLAYFGKKNESKEKLNKSFVSEADLEANKAIVNIIKNEFPTHSILSEEAEFEDNNSNFKWVIDPLDGTHNFLHHIPVFGTTIALEYKNEVVLGIIHIPFLKLIAFAEKGKGAFLNGKRMKVSSQKDIHHSFILFEFAFTDRHKKISLMQRLSSERFDLRNFGSAVFGLVMIASGRCDAYFIFKTNEWDIAAGALMVEEAGGKVTDTKGNRWKPDSDNFIMSNAKLHGKLLGLLK